MTRRGSLRSSVEEQLGSGRAEALQLAMSVFWPGEHVVE